MGPCRRAVAPSSASLGTLIKRSNDGLVAAVRDWHGEDCLWCRAGALADQDDSGSTARAHQTE